MNEPEVLAVARLRHTLADDHFKPACTPASMNVTAVQPQRESRYARRNRLLFRLAYHRLGKKALRSSPIFFSIRSATSWQPLLKSEDGSIDRRLWEISLALAVRDALRGGGLYLPERRHHVSFSNLIYDEQLWERDRKGAYEQPSLFHEGDQSIAALMSEFEQTARQTEAGLPANPFASV